MSEIKVGDRVRIAEDVSLRRYKNSCGWNHQMVSLLGTEGTVIEVNSEMGWAIVESKEDGRQWAWYLDDLTVVPEGHLHAEYMKEYAEDAATHDRPWELWESRSAPSVKWEGLTTHPLWTRSTEYRRKSTHKTVLVNGVEVAAPETTEPTNGTMYWVPEIFYSRSNVWRGTHLDKKLLSNGLVYLNQKDAIVRRKAMQITKEVDHGSN